MAEKRYRRVTPWPLVFVFVLFAFAIGAAGRKYYQAARNRSRLEIQGELASIASLKTDQISEWRASVSTTRRSRGGGRGRRRRSSSFSRGPGRRLARPARGWKRSGSLSVS